jgi:DeoR/GlpR family transcriptional regulator of sugar metabolism
MATQVTEAELLAAIFRDRERPALRPEGALTVAELVARSGWTERRVRRVLSGLKETGSVEVVHVIVTNLADQPCQKPAYRLSSGCV